MAAPSPALPAMAPISAPPAAPPRAPVPVRCAVGLRSAQADSERAMARRPAVARRWVTIDAPGSVAVLARGGLGSGVRGCRRAGIGIRGPAHQAIQRLFGAALRVGPGPGNEGDLHGLERRRWAGQAEDRRPAG